MELAKQLIDLLKPYFESITVDHEVPHRVELRASGLRVDAPVIDPPRFYILEGGKMMAEFDTRSGAEKWMDEQRIGNYYVIVGHRQDVRSSVVYSHTIQEN